MADSNRREGQIDLSQQLQDMLLRAYKDRLEAGTISDTGLGQLQKLLMSNGWSLDPAQIKRELGEQLTSRVDPEELDDEDPDVIDILDRRTGT